MDRINFYDWLSEAEEPTAAQAPTTDPSAPAKIPDQPTQTAGKPETKAQEPEQEDNVEDDPVSPDQEEDSAEKDFEQWRHDFCDLSIKGDINEMMASIQQVVDREGLEFSQRRFINDNMQILLYRQEANIIAATKQIRNLVKDDLDRTNPGTTLMQHLTTVIEKDPLLTSPLIKMTGLYASKGEYHRKFLASLMGAIQVGGGASKQDLMYFDKEYTINFSTRFATQYGEINLGKWSLKTDDPMRYLTEPEMDRLSEGSPEEKQTLRRRIIVESIGEKFKERAFLIHIVHPDGTIHALGWDLGDSLLSAYKEGKIVVRGKQNSEKDAMISDTGEIIGLVDVDILFVRETGETDDDGNPDLVEVPFLERRDSILYLVCDLETLQEASNMLSGMFFRQTPYGGNPSDVIQIAKCVPSLPEILNKRCM
jgi:hypothetical protein